MTQTKQLPAWTMFNPADAESKAAELQAEYPDWTYKVNHDPKSLGYSLGEGCSLVQIFDETGEFVSNL